VAAVRLAGVVRRAGTRSMPAHPTCLQPTAARVQVALVAVPLAMEQREATAR